MFASAIRSAVRRPRIVHSIRALTLRPMPIAEAPSDGWLRIDGTALVRQDEQGLVTPCGGEPAVWFRLRVHRHAGSGGPGGGRLWVTVIDETEARPFDVRDQTGTTATVIAAHARVVTQAKTYLPPPAPPSRPRAVERGVLLPEAQVRVGEFASRHGRDFWPGDLYEEHWISPGDRLSVIGFAGQQAGSPIATPYRQLPSRVLVLEGTPGRPIFIARSTRVGFAANGDRAAWWSRVKLFWRSL